MLTISPYFSTQVAKCFEIHGTKCANWNSEGQWLLRRDTVFDRAFKPGKMCPIEPSLFQDIHLFSMAKQKLHAQWGEYWDLNSTTSLTSTSSMPSRLSSSAHNYYKKILVEKSPQNMVKIPFIAKAFQHARSLNFLVVIKHPVTLNIALPRGFEWMSRVPPPSLSFTSKDSSQVNDVSRKQSQKKIPWNSTDLIESFEYFIKFMTANVSKGSDCNLGWLSTMEELLMNTQGKLSSNVTIVKYEDFIDPIKACQLIMNIITTGEGINQMEAFGRFCRKHFSPKARTRDPFTNSEQIIAQRREEKKYNNRFDDRFKKQSSKYRYQYRRRKLRLKGVLSKGNNGGPATMTGIKEKQGYQMLNFDLRMLESSVHTRLIDFKRAYTMLTTYVRTKDNSDLKKKSIEIVSAIHGINTRLTVFGYSLPIDDFRNYITIQSVKSHHDKYHHISRQEIDPYLGLVNGTTEFTKMRLPYH